MLCPFFITTGITLFDLDIPFLLGINVHFVHIYHVDFSVSTETRKDHMPGFYLEFNKARGDA